MTRVLLVGSGAREHAIAAAIMRSANVHLFAAMSSRNPGIIKLAKEAALIKIADAKAVADYAVQKRVELAIIGPEAPLVAGVVDVLSKLGIRTVGPTQQLARLEGDKAFCRQLLQRHGIAGNPDFRVFTDPDSAESFLRSAGPVAIKPTGLTGGKGVKVSGEDFANKEAEIAYAKQVLGKCIGGVQKLVVEERLDGEEYSLQAFVDGNNVLSMPLVQDHKRAYENDVGPNTGGMGSYSDRDHLLPFVSQGELEQSSRIMADVVRSLKEDTGEAYRGILYGQFMLARSANEEKPSPKLIEFNCRFGDPEAMNVLPILTRDSDFVGVCDRIAEGTLKPKNASFERKATVCKYMVPADYPDNATTGQVISVDEDAITRQSAHVFYASVDLKDEQVVTTSSRTVGILGVSGSIESAERIAEEATSHVIGPLRHRKDIGTQALIQKRIDHVRSIHASPTKPQVLQAGIL